MFTGSFTIILLALLASTSAIRRGGPIIKVPTTGSTSASPTIELPDQLTSGLIFTEMRTFYMSLAEWNVVVKIPAIHAFSEHLQKIRENALGALRLVNTETLKNETPNFD